MGRKKVAKSQGGRRHDPVMGSAEVKAAEASAKATDAGSEAVAQNAHTEPAPPLAKGSVVDVVFDHLTGLATRGLSVAKRGLEASARWLDSQARRAGDLAVKLRKGDQVEASSNG